MLCNRTFWRSHLQEMIFLNVAKPFADIEHNVKLRMVTCATKFIQSLVSLTQAAGQVASDDVGCAETAAAFGAPGDYSVKQKCCCIRREVAP